MTLARDNNGAGAERIGVILVHGIGEQRRFEHLDSQLRYLVQSLRAMPEVQDVTVDIGCGGTGAFRAAADTWAAGPKPSATVVVHHTLRGSPQESRLGIHEVWWADVNEPYSLAKQFRFWLWGLALWAHPGKPASALPSASMVATPVVPAHSWLWDRFRLFLVGVMCALIGVFFGLVFFLAERVLDIRSPNLLRVLTNYLSGIKLYAQRRRYGPGLFWSREDFLDSIGDPPRVSVRRRMIRAIADVACRDPGDEYERWYILAHSLGTVVAFNGLMETNYAWPGYLDEPRWNRLLKAGMAGPWTGPANVGDGTTMPARPGWVPPDGIAYRKHIFGRFRGFLTYGSPLEKFAAIWPALVPINRQPVFGLDVEWINLFDPIDPVSGVLKAYAAQPAACCPRPVNCGYRAGSILLLAHLDYLIARPKREPDAARAVGMWLLTGSSAKFGSIAPPVTKGWFTPGSATRAVRSAVAWASWIAAAIVIDLISAAFVRLYVPAICSGLVGLWHWLTGVVS